MESLQRASGKWPGNVLALFMLFPLAGGQGAVGDGASAPFQGISERSPTGSPDVSAEGLVAAYDMETTTADGRLRDFGPHGLHGSFSVPAATDGVFGRARSFERVEARVDLPEDPAFDRAGPLTVAAWVRVDGTGLHQHIAACDDRWALWVTPDDEYRLGDTRGGGWSSPPGAVREGVWTPVVAVLDGTAGDPISAEAFALWVAGERVEGRAHLRSDGAREAGAWSPRELYPDDACYLGFESHQGNEAHQEMPFAGAIDEILVFSRALAGDEVRAFSTR